MSFRSKDIREKVAQFGKVAKITVATTRGSVPREEGTSMLVWEGGQSGTIGGGGLEFEAVARALQAKGLSQIALGPSLGQCCGGHVTLLTEHFDENSSLQVDDNNESRQPIWIYGAGHIGRAIVNIVSPLTQFEITWVDTSLSRFPASEFDNVTKLPTIDPSKAVTLAPSDARHLVLTYSHDLDLEICHQLLGHEFQFAGLIGSKTKWARFQSKLTKLGHALEKINRITCPIGDPALGKHPQQIAVGVASSLLSRRRVTALGKDRAI
jgi:xanthine dehydrogenase accessory factor